MHKGFTFQLLNTVTDEWSIDVWICVESVSPKTNLWAALPLKVAKGLLLGSAECKPSRRHLDCSRPLCKIYIRVYAACITAVGSSPRLGCKRHHQTTLRELARGSLLQPRSPSLWEACPYNHFLGVPGHIELGTRAMCVA
ncbi:unnamed protein product [Ixodes persulcatus]